jgi:acyl-CoA thioesterase FadM
MSRIKLSEQSEYEFHHTITLQPRDINYGGHLGNDSLVSLLGTVRADTLRSMGLSEADLGDSRTGIIMSDLVVNFRAEGFMFDELLIDTHIGELNRTGFRIFHRVTKGRTLIALAETGITTFDYVSRKIAPVPGAFLKALQGKPSDNLGS